MRGDLALSDRIAMTLSPKWAAERVLNRLRAEELLKLSASTNTGPQRSETRWRGASQQLRSLTAWQPPLGSGRSDLTKRERDRLAARSQDAYRNFLIARAAVTRMRTSVVGVGLQMYPDVDHEALGLTEEQGESLNDQISREWSLYYDNPTEVDLEGSLDGSGLQSLAAIAAWLTGDCFALTPFKERIGGIYGLKIQLVDGARVSNRDGGPDSQFLQDGIEIEADGAPLAVWIRNRHPDDRTLGMIDAWTRREIYGESGMRRVLQIWNDKDRIGATRGTPFLAPILEPLQNIETYSRAELTAAVISSLFTVFIKKDAQQTDERGNPVKAIQGQETTPEGHENLELGSGAVLDLAPGEDAVFADPTRPNAKYDPFFLSVVKQIGAALEIPMEELLLFYSSSYSAARAAMLQAWRMYGMRRWWLVQQFCQPHYCLWLDEAVARGRIQMVNYADPARRAAYQRAVWTGPARGAMDEGQEVKAARDRIDGGLSTEAIEIPQLVGESRRSVYRQRKREVEQRRRDGMEIGPAPGQGAPPGGGRPAPRPGRDPLRPSDNPPRDEPEDETEERAA